MNISTLNEVIVSADQKSAGAIAVLQAEVQVYKTQADSLRERNAALLAALEEISVSQHSSDYARETARAALAQVTP